MISRQSFFRLIKEPEETLQSHGRSTRHYLVTFDQFYGQGPWFSSWNWASFFMALFGAELVWLIYRRMYFYAFLYFLIMFVLSYGVIGLLLFFGKDIRALAMQKFSDKDAFFMAIKTGLWLIKLPIIISFGVWGNALYFRFLEKADQKKEKPKSGVSTLAAGGFFIFSFSVILLNNYLLQTTSTNLYSKAYELFLG